MHLRSLLGCRVSNDAKFRKSSVEVRYFVKIMLRGTDMWTHRRAKDTMKLQASLSL
jgi:hypothetical protein